MIAQDKHINIKTGIYIPFRQEELEGKGSVPSDFNHLLDTLEGLTRFPAGKVEVALVSVPESRSTAAAFKEELKKHVAVYKNAFHLAVYSYEEALSISGRFILADRSKFTRYTDLKRKGGVCNLCLMISTLLEHSIVIYLRPGIVLNDIAVLEKIETSLGSTSHDEKIEGIAGCMLGRLYPETPAKNWISPLWDEELCMEVLKKNINDTETWQKAPYVNTAFFALSQTLFSELPFDPAAAGEPGLDYLVNAHNRFKMIHFGNGIWARGHCLRSSDPPWLVIRKAIHRICYLRKKMEHAGTMEILHEMEPYPSRFLGRIWGGNAFQVSLKGIFYSLVKLDLRQTLRFLGNVLYPLIFSRKKLHAQMERYDSLLAEWHELLRILGDDTELKEYIRNVFADNTQNNDEKIFKLDSFQ
jgi:hypothetical protein